MKFEDTETGQLIEFDWLEIDPPTEQDMAEIADAYYVKYPDRLKQKEPAPSTYPITGSPDERWDTGKMTEVGVPGSKPVLPQGQEIPTMAGLRQFETKEREPSTPSEALRNIRPSAIDVSLQGTPAGVIAKTREEVGAPQVANLQAEPQEVYRDPVSAIDVASKSFKQGLISTPNDILKIARAAGLPEERIKNSPLSVIDDIDKATAFTPQEEDYINSNGISGKLISGGAGMLGQLPSFIMAGGIAEKIVGKIILKGLGKRMLRDAATFGAIQGVSGAGTAAEEGKSVYDAIGQSLKETAKGMATGAVFGLGGEAVKGAGLIKRVATQAGLGGGLAAVEGGGPSDIASQAVLFGGMGVLGGKKTKAKEVAEKPIDFTPVEPIPQVAPAIIEKPPTPATIERRRRPITFEGMTEEESKEILGLLPEDKRRKLEASERASETVKYTDQLTGTLNRQGALKRGHIEEVINEKGETEDALTDGPTAMFDIDFFKKVNDTYGHATGDKVLKSFGTILKKHLSQYGDIVRYGGEEFALKGFDKLKKNSILNSVGEARKEFLAQEFAKGKLKQVNFSAGFSDIDPTDADKQLYSAKEAGRGRTFVGGTEYGEPPVQQDVKQAKLPGKTSVQAAVKPETPSAAKAAPEVTPQEGIGVYRRDTSDAILTANKPHGLYLSKVTENFKTPHEEVGDTDFTGIAKPKNPLVITEPPKILHERFKGATTLPQEPSAGISALHKLLPQKEFDRLIKLKKNELVKELSNKFPGPDYSKYFDSYELLEAYGGQVARGKGYDAIIQDDRLDPNFNEIVILDDSIVKIKKAQRSPEQPVATAKGVQEAQPKEVKPSEIAKPEAVKEPILEEKEFFEPGMKEREKVAVHGAAEIPVVDEVIGPFVRKWFTKERGLPAKTFDLKVKRDAEKNALEQEMQYRVVDLMAGVRKAYPKAITEAQAYDIDSAIKGEIEFAKLPEPLQKPAEAMRKFVDGLSQKMLDIGLIDEKSDLAETIKKNFGHYIHRAYKAVHEPEYRKHIPEPVKKQAFEYLQKKIGGRKKTLESRAAKIEKSAKRLSDRIEADFFKDDEDLIAARANLDKANMQAKRIRATAAEIDDTPGAIEGQLRAMVDKFNRPMHAMIREGKLGSKDLTIFMRRLEMAPEIRAYLGEYKDPVANFEFTVLPMIRDITNHEFMTEVRAEGLNKFLYEKPIVKEGEAYTYQIAAEGSHAMAPLNGLYTSKEIRDAFELSTQMEPLPDWLRWYMKGIALTKYSKTILHQTSQIRNFLSNIGFAVAAGAWNPAKFKDSYKAIAVRIFNMKKQEQRDYTTDLLRRGVLGESIRFGEIRDVFGESIKKNWSLPQLLDSRQARILKGLKSGLEKLYGGSDDFWKVFIYENLVSEFRAAKPNLPIDQIKDMAAERVRNLTPTYSMISKGVESIRRFPFVATFVSFVSEIPRTTYHHINYLQQELRDPELRKYGIKHLAGLIAAAGMIDAVVELGKTVTGIDDEEDAAAREFLPPWSKNSSVLWSAKKGKGRYRYYDLGYIDPYNYLKEPLRAYLKGEDWKEKSFGVMQEMAGPFLSEDILTQRFISIQRNKKPSGAAVYNPKDEINQQMKDVATYVFEGIEPGALSSYKRLYKGLTGEEVNLYGTRYDPRTEATALFTGLRQSNVDIPRSLIFQAGKFKRDMQDAAIIKRKGTEAAYVKGMRSSYDDMKDYIDSAKLLGVDNNTIVRSLISGNMGSNEIGIFLSPRYTEIVDDYLKAKAKVAVIKMGVSKTVRENIMKPEEE